LIIGTSLVQPEKVKSHIVSRYECISIVSSQIADNVISTVDGVLNTETNILLDSDNELQTSSNILKQLDTLALNQPANSEARTITKPNIGFGILKPDSDKAIVIKSPGNGSPNFTMTQMTDSDAETSSSDASIVLSPEVVGKSLNKTIYSYLFRNPSLFLSRNGNISIQSAVISATVSDVTVTNLSDPVRLTFGSRKPNVTGLVNTCKFFDVTKESKYGLL